MLHQLAGMYHLVKLEIIAWKRGELQNTSASFTEPGQPIKTSVDANHWNDDRGKSFATDIVSCI